MAIFGIGCDIEETARFLNHRNCEDSFCLRYFTKDELAYCKSRPNPEQHLAARFCAKEAFYKALGTGVGQGMTLKECEVIRDPNGQPSLALQGKALECVNAAGISALHLSLSHTDALAQAFVVLETQPIKS